MAQKGKGSIVHSFTHDKVFRKAFENPLLAQEFFEVNLPSYVKDVIDTSTLKLDKETFVEDDLSYSSSDVLFSVKFTGNTDGYIYILLEHQNKPDAKMAFRLFKYMVSICDRHMKLYPEEKRLPLIYPLLFYQGKQKYNVARNIYDLSVNPKLAKKFWLDDYQLINLSQVPDDELKRYDWYGSLAFLMKHITQKNLIKVWEELAGKLPKLAKVEVGKDYIKLLLAYTLTKIEENDKVKMKSLLDEKLGDKEGENLMTSVAQKWYDDGLADGKAEGLEQGLEKGMERGIEKGIERGLEQGLKKTATNMLKQDLSIKLIKQITGLSDDEILKLKSNH